MGRLTTFLGVSRPMFRCCRWRDPSKLAATLPVAPKSCGTISASSADRLTPRQIRSIEALAFDTMQLVGYRPVHALRDSSTSVRSSSACCDSRTERRYSRTVRASRGWRARCDSISIMRGSWGRRRCVCLIGLILFLTASIVFGFDPGPAPGIKIKNAFLYLLVLGLILRVTLDRSYRLQMPSVPILFSIMIAYGLFSYIAIILVIQYPRYDWLTAGLILKNSLFDQMLFFLVFFYGLRSNEDALTVLKVLLGSLGGGARCGGSGCDGPGSRGRHRATQRRARAGSGRRVQ